MTQATLLEIQTLANKLKIMYPAYRTQVVFIKGQPVVQIGR